MTDRRFGGCEVRFRHLAGAIRSLEVLGRAGVQLRDHTVDRWRESRVGIQFGPAQPGDCFSVAVHFSGSEKSIYQLRQWLWPLERLNKALMTDGHSPHPVAIFCRNIGIAQQLARETHLPVRFGRLSKDVDAFFAGNPLRIVFYVNQNLLNFQTMRYPEPAHVHLSHGESEKISMSSNQLKAYDEVFVAGDAARARIQRRLINLPSERLRDVGRPQLDEHVDPPADWLPDPRRHTVLYAPTWEGDSPAMSYSSLSQHGEAIVCSLMEKGWQVIYRPHPHTGMNDAATRTANERIIHLLREHAGNHPNMRHYVDQSSRIGWQQAEADACVCDMSAVAFDWLISGKPLVMIEPGPGAVIDSHGLIGRIPLLPAASAGNVASVLESALESGQSDALQDLALHYFGDTTPGAQIGRFISESRRLAQERTCQIQEKQQPSNG